MPLSDDGLHLYLEARAAGPNHTVVVEQVHEAEHFRVSPSTLNRALKRMVRAGRLDQVGEDDGRGPHPRTYVVHPFDEWKMALPQPCRPTMDLVEPETRGLLRR